MSGEGIFLTKEGYEKLTKELYYLKTVRRREISKEIKEAREHGDISENAEYEAAKEKQAFMETRILQLETKLSQARIIDDKRIPKGRAYLGATVLLRDLESGEELSYTLLGGDEADSSEGKISVHSPVAKGLLGHKAGDRVEIRVPAGIRKYKILKIS
ncbi:transcription elongation factor GreA [bacterium]|nr:transcription elongation factor GreA [bacterium]MCG2676762.1 transcription elongation factor GreA [bacterium]MCG2677172.1 transcription elongation factor GreA [bacterium]